MDFDPDMIGYLIARGYVFENQARMLWVPSPVQHGERGKNDAVRLIRSQLGLLKKGFNQISFTVGAMAAANSFFFR